MKQRNAGCRIFSSMEQDKTHFPGLSWDYQMDGLSVFIITFSYIIFYYT
jgi:hypothetical protein